MPSVFYQFTFDLAVESSGLESADVLSSSNPCPSISMRRQRKIYTKDVAKHSDESKMKQKKAKSIHPQSAYINLLIEKMDLVDTTISFKITNRK